MKAFLKYVQSGFYDGTLFHAAIRLRGSDGRDLPNRINGGDVLPGLALPLHQLFARVPRAPAKKSKGRSSPKKPRKK